MGAFDFVGDLFNKASRTRAANEQNDARAVWDNTGANANITAGTAAQQDAENPDARNAQSSAMNQLAAVGSQGGMDAGSVAALQQAQMSNNQQAKSGTDAALERAQAEGRLNGGRALSAQIQANQGANNANAMAGTQAAADARTRAMNALSSAGSLGGSIRGQDQNVASAKNQINEFNATQGQNAQQQTFNNQAVKASGIANADQQLANTNLGRAAEARESAGAIGDAVVKGATQAAMGGMATGGAVPGYAKVSGDSPENDTVPAKLSPGEIVIPRSVVAGGPDAVKHFVMGLLSHHGSK